MKQLGQLSGRTYLGFTSTHADVHLQFAGGRILDGYTNHYELACVTCRGSSSGKVPPPPPVSPASTAKGEVFTRWGRRDCPTGSQLLYDGMGAGAVRLADWICRLPGKARLRLRGQCP